MRQYFFELFILPCTYDIYISRHRAYDAILLVVHAATNTAFHLNSNTPPCVHPLFMSPARLSVTHTTPHGESCYVPGTRTPIIFFWLVFFIAFTQNVSPPPPTNAFLRLYVHYRAFEKFSAPPPPPAARYFIFVPRNLLCFAVLARSRFFFFPRRNDNQQAVHTQKHTFKNKARTWYTPQV